MLARADADALFTTVYAGDFGTNSDGSVFRASALGQVLDTEELGIPCSASLPMDESGETFPYCFVADETFPLKVSLMRRYPRRMPTNKRRIFNYRLSGARECVECAFGILTATFKISEGPICCKKETVILIVKAFVLLHNFIRIREGVFWEIGESFAVHPSAIPPEHEDDGRQR
ncbi:hypothetical protein Cfor_11855 [Coptotermes formosanus]|jgi:hypothetical protein|uniref:DDE Tnp4 domain-containing protein n=1 Tax=Coptotermes formosanus TaxID=36987 RepID=A0A6L2PV94_COPFO|nr:hypothetical protein Cfor_11855 [Coptotermes formosanus]